MPLARLLSLSAVSSSAVVADFRLHLLAEPAAPRRHSALLDAGLPRRRDQSRGETPEPHLQGQHRPHARTWAASPAGPRSR